MLVTSKHAVSVYCVMSPLLIDRNQNFFTLKTKKKLKKYIKKVFKYLREHVKKNKCNNQPGGISCYINASVLENNVRWHKTKSCHLD